MISFSNLRPLPIESLGINPKSDILGTKKCEFQPGQRYLIKAPSGKGKSTILHIIYGLRKDFTGEVNLEGKSSDSFSDDQWSDWRQCKIAIVFQDLRLFPQLTGLENIRLNGGWKGDADEAEIIRMAEKLGIADLLEQKAETLSYGQRQRVAIIRALIQPFDYLLLDEPFSHLDEANTKQACELIQEKLTANDATLFNVQSGRKVFPRIRC